MFAERHHDIGGNTGQFTEVPVLRTAKNQWHQRRTALANGYTKLSSYIIPKGRSAHFRDRQAAGGNNQRRSGERCGISQQNKLVRSAAIAVESMLAPHLPDVCPEKDPDIRGGTLV